MSRSNPNAANANPTTRWFEWRGADGKLQYFDKSKGDGEENVEVPLPFRFMVLDQLNTVSGYHKKKGGITANEVRDISDTLHVRFFKGADIATGPWAAIKKDVAFEKGSFTKSCYIAFKDGDELKIGNIRMSGCALGPWIEFGKSAGKSLEEKGVILTKGERDTSGTVDFTPPEFSIMEISEETNAKATELDRKLQEFLKGYLAKGAPSKGSDRLPGEEDYSQERPESESIPTDREPVTEPEDDDIPF